MEPFTLIIFGITSNLAQKYILHALYDMTEKKLLPKNSAVIGVARQPRTPQEIKDFVRYALHSENRHHTHTIKEDTWENLSQTIHYVDGNLDDSNFYPKLKGALDKLSTSQNRIFYLATYPDLYEDIFKNLKQTNLSNQDKGWVKLLVEKPIGYDLPSSQNINQLLGQYFSEDQIYRLDHYLGKETLQNILTFRFGNGIFEPLINKDYIDHIQITSAEDFGVGARGGYYDRVGALKDVGQNHLLQMLTFATMDAPQEFTNQAVTNERIKLLQQLIPIPEKVVFGQYEDYKLEENINPKSNTDTFFAFKTEIANTRFRGVPIYVRGGKKLKQTATEISIVFKKPINRLFSHLNCGDEPNVLIYRIQPSEGIVLKILTKLPGHEMKLMPEYMQYCYPQSAEGHALPDPYERLLLDAIKGDQTFFADAEEVEAEWRFIDPLANTRKKPFVYKPGSWGPKQADELIETDGRSWLEPSVQFCSIS